MPTLTQPCLKVLLIDPNQTDRQFFEDHLRLISDEYVVLTVSSGKAGLQLCQSKPFDCIVTELTLPDTSGFGLLCSLVPRVTQPQMAVIVLTRHFSTIYEELALSYGAQACLSKSRETIWTTPSVRPSLRSRETRLHADPTQCVECADPHQPHLLNSAH